MFWLPWYSQVWMWRWGHHALPKWQEVISIITMFQHQITAYWWHSLSSLIMKQNHTLIYYKNMQTLNIHNHMIAFGWAAHATININIILYCISQHFPRLLHHLQMVSHLQEHKAARQTVQAYFSSKNNIVIKQHQMLSVAHILVMKKKVHALI